MHTLGNIIESLLLIAYFALDVQRARVADALECLDEPFDSYLSAPSGTSSPHAPGVVGRLPSFR